jgi:amino acid adenylation domain-containing protein
MIGASEPRAPLSDVKRALLERRLRGLGGAGASSAIPKAQGPRRAPLTPTQTSIWLADQLHDDNALHNLADAIWLDGPLDEGALTRALAACQKRHEVLRARVVSDGAGALEVDDAAPLPLRRVDLSGYAPDEAEARARALAEAEAGAAFDPARAPLWRAVLAQTAPERRLLVIVAHHLIADGWSLGVAMGDVQREYGLALRAGTGLGSPEPDLQFIDYAAWLAQRPADAARKAAQVEEAVATLRGASPLITFPADRPRPSTFQVRGGCERFCVDAGTRAGVIELSRAASVSPFAVLMTAFMATLSRMSGERQVVVGTPVAMRHRPEVSALVGPFIDSAVCAARFEEEVSFADAAAEVWASISRMLRERDFGFGDLLEALRTRRDLAAHPLFQVMFIYHNWPLPELRFDGLRATRIDLWPGTSKYDLTLVMEDRDGRLDGRVEYSAALYNPDTVQRIWSAFICLLRAALADPRAAVARLPLVDAGEAVRLTEGLNPAPVARDFRTVPDLVAARAAEQPHASAVEDAAGSWTRAQLAEAACDIAAALHARGVRPGDRVGVYLDRSRLLVATLLAVLRAGAAYVPLDVAYPRERRLHMCADAGLACIVTSAHRVGDLEGFPSPTLTLESVAPGAVAPPPVSLSPDDIAYVIYTSGSTGRPKGVAVPHAAFANLLEDFVERLAIAPQDRFLASTPVSFDIAHGELFWPLVAGAQLYIAPTAAGADPEALAALLTRQVPDLYQATPSTFRLLLASGWAPRAPLRLLCGGEALAPDLAEALTRGGAALWNVYGPTETTIWSAAARVTNDGPIRLGTAISNTRLYVLDDFGGLLPFGAPGELCISGAGVAAGYIGQPELTAQRFVPDPFAPGQRMYRTGDLVRWADPGELEFLGRRDGQLKVRGHRIEPGEIEACLRTHPAVADAVVEAVLEDGRAEGLIAFVVAPPNAVTLEALREHLAASLPASMIPGVIQLIEEVPRTPAGKVDRTALRRSRNRGDRVGGAYVAPRTPVEAALAEIWGASLGLEQVGVHDNFFEIGGHSLLAMKVARAIEDHLKRRLPFRKFIHHQTIAELARAVEDVDAASEARLDIERRAKPWFLRT